MENKIKFLDFNGKKYPILFSLNVMESIQEKYGSLGEWSNLMQPEDEKEPSLSVVLETFTMAINEGIEYINFIENKEEKLINKKVVGYIVTELGLKGASDTIANIFVESTKEDNPKNE